MQNGFYGLLYAVTSWQFNGCFSTWRSRKWSRFTSTHIVCCSWWPWLEWCWISRLKNTNPKHWQAGFGRGRARQLLRSSDLYSYEKRFDDRKVSNPHWWVGHCTDFTSVNYMMTATQCSLHIHSPWKVLKLFRIWKWGSSENWFRQVLI